MEKFLVPSGALTFVLAFVGYYLSFLYECGYSVHCYNLVFHVGHPLFYGGGALAVVFVLLYIYPQAFNAWKKFAVWFVPLAALLFVFYPNPGSGDLLAPMPEQVFQWVSAVYVIVSGIIVALKK